MGRQAYLTRLALGRSALQAPEDSPGQESNKGDRTGNSKYQPIDSWSYKQIYDSRGHAINPASTDLKRRLAHAQNDVLATVGVCAKVDNSKPLRPSEAFRQQQIEIIKSENDAGLNLSIAEGVAVVLIEPWGVGLRQRLQTFKFYTGVPLATIIKTDWKICRLLGSLYAGTLASWAFYSIDSARLEIHALMNYSYGSLNPLHALHISTLSKRISPRVVTISLKFLDVVSFILLTPLEIYATLQRLGIISAWPIFPSMKCYKTILAGLMRMPTSPQPSPLQARRRYLQSTALMPLCIWAVIFYTKPIVTRSFYRYFRAALPKPTHPDRYSIEATEGEHDFEAIPGSIYEDLISGAERENSTVVDLLQKDLRAIGRNCQILWIRVSDAIINPRASLLRVLKFRSIPEIKVSEASQSSSSTDSTVQSLPDDLREAMESFPGHNAILPQPDAVLGLDPQLQDLLVPMPATDQDPSIQPSANRAPSILTVSMRESAEALTPPSTENERSSRETADELADQATRTTSPTLGSSSSSPAQSRIPTPLLPIEIITSTSGVGHMHTNVTSPLDVRESGSTSGFQAPSISSTDPSSEDDESNGDEHQPYHRVTLLSAHAADTMAEHLSRRFADLLFLPLEALFVRSVAYTFWQAPGLAVGGRGAAGRWKGDVFPMGGWFGTGFKAGGWRGAGEYAGKMLLIWGLQVGTNFALWELTTGYMWVAGRRWYDWYNL